MSELRSGETSALGIPGPQSAGVALFTEERRENRKKSNLGSTGYIPSIDLDSSHNLFYLALKKILFDRP